MASVSPRQDLGELLRPYVDGLANLRGSQSDSRLPATIAVGSRSIEVDYWVRELIPDPRRAGNDGEHPWHYLLAEGLALQTKILSDVDRFAGAGADAADGGESAVAALKLDAAMGYALMTELQRIIDHLVISGDLDNARKLTQFKNKLGQSVAALKQDIGQSELDDAEKLAPSLVREPRETHRPSNRKTVTDHDVQALLKLEEELMRQQQQRSLGGAAAAAAAEPAARLPKEAAPRRRRSHRTPLMVALALLVTAWLVFTVRPALLRVELPVLDATDFAGIGEIRQVVARPPSLFVTVDDRGWSALEPAAREKLVDTVGRRIAEAGYLGARFSDSRGRTVARWLETKGAQLVETAPAPAAGPVRQSSGSTSTVDAAR